jgi:error-prone DNA polymerase
VERAASLDMGALAVTDHNNVSAAVEFTKCAREAGIKPVQGAELTLADGSHLVLLAQDSKGYSNLCRILTTAHMSAQRRNPGARLEDIEPHTGHMIALSGCRKGIIPSLIAAGKKAEAHAAAVRLARVFGRSNFYIELENPLTPGAAGLIRALSDLARAVGVGTVVTNNVHYAEKSGFWVHDALTAVRTLTTLDDVHPERRINGENYLKSPEEMTSLFADYPEALSNTVEIAERCSHVLDLSLRLFPKFPTPCGEPAAAYLESLVMQGAAKRYGRITEGIRARLSHELGIIRALGFEDYFLAVWDVARWAQSQGIRYAGRGSAADSAVAYCLFLTNVDSIVRGLLFERFMSLERAQKPDIDIDFEAGRRDDVAKYVYSRYGTEHVASVCTFNTFQGRAAVRDFGRALGFPEQEIDWLAKKLPHVPADGIRAAFERYPELRTSGIPAWKFELLLSLAESVAGFPRHIGTHLGGVVISGEPLTTITPLQMAAKGVAITQFDKNFIEDLGLIKLDLLSLRTLSAVEQATSTIRDHDPSFEYNRIPHGDRATYEMLNRGETIGVFQLESPAQRGLQTRLGARDIEDVIASVALIRPGPIQGNMVEPFIARRRGLEGISYIHPKLEPILRKTYGVVLYQEQVIEIATAIAGFTPGESDKLRKVMTHVRSMREMERIGTHFIERAVENGISPEVAQTIFSYILGYAGYGFCEAHAAAFADTAYKTAYMVNHYPAHFYAAVLSSQPMGFYPPRTILVEAKRRGVRILPLDVNRSQKKFSVEGGAIRVGLMQVKGISERMIDDLVAARADGEFRSVTDFLLRVPVDRDIMDNLVLAGAFDSVEPNRRALFWRLGTLMAQAAAEHDMAARAGPGRLFESSGSSVRDSVPDFSPTDKFKHEMSILGFCVDYHAMEFLRPRLARAGVRTSRDIHAAKNGEAVTVAGLVVRPHRPPTKSGKIVVFLSLEDEFGLVDVTVFERVYQEFGGVIYGNPGLLVTGNISRRGDGVSVIARTVQGLGRRRSSV